MFDEKEPSANDPSHLQMQGFARKSLWSTHDAMEHVGSNADEKLIKWQSDTFERHWNIPCSTCDTSAGMVSWSHPSSSSINSNSFVLWIVVYSFSALDIACWWNKREWAIIFLSFSLSLSCCLPVCLSLLSSLSVSIRVPIDDHNAHSSQVEQRKRKRKSSLGRCPADNRQRA